MRKNFNAKVTRLEKDPSIPREHIPERIYKEDITTRRDFNMLKKKVQDFTARGSEQIVEYKGQQVPLHQKKQVIRMAKSISARRAHQRAQLSREGATLTLENLAQTKKPNLEKPRTAEEWRRFIQSLEKQFSDKWTKAQAETYKQNYIDSVKRYLGDYSDAILERIENLPASEFVRAGRTHDTVTIKFIYDPLDAELKAEEIFNQWSEILGDTDATFDDYL